jgi:undecaprenyl phosphate-alpha-L-ara4N flippase subunit ArnE
MTLVEAALLAVVVAANVGGQLLFKVSADAISADNDPVAIALKLSSTPAMWGALVLYGVTIVAWVWVLRTIPLSIAYSAVALVFVLVPLLASAVFGEKLSAQFLVGSALIAGGVLIVQLHPR